MHQAIAIIPARFGSSRFPGKPLANQTGKPLIRHVVERVRQAGLIERVLVATDDQRIFDAVSGFGCEVVMTRGDHPNGTSRIAEVVEQLGAGVTDDAVVVNVQGDEPQVEPRVIDELVQGLLAEPAAGGAPMATLASEFSPGEDPRDPNIVKLVLGCIQGRHRALYFSRSLIPFDRDPHKTQGQVKPLKHPGLYAYRRGFLLRYVQLPPTPLEQAEQLEQLRALEHGYPIAVVKTRVEHHGIDTPQQYDEFVKWWRMTGQ